MRVTLASLLSATRGEYALAHFSVNRTEQVLGLFEGAREAAAPVVVGLSRAAWDYATPEVLEAAVATIELRYPDVLFALHHDHGDIESCRRAVTVGGYGGVMIDAADEPLARNIEVTADIVRYAHARGVSVEAELGAVGGAEDHVSREAVLTDPETAARFVAESGCDALAVSVGTVHGAAKFGPGEGIDFERIRRIRDAVPETPLVLHGASSIDPAEVARVNAAGGDLDPSKRGPTAEDYRHAIGAGIAKINIDGDGRLLWTRVHREHFRSVPTNIDFRVPGAVFVSEFRELVCRRIDDFGARGRTAEAAARLSIPPAAFPGRKHGVS